MPDMEETLSERLAAAIEEVFRRVEGGIVTRWVLVAESVGPEGDRGLWCQRSKDMHPWEFLGMLDFALEVERASFSLEDDDD